MSHSAAERLETIRLVGATRPGARPRSAGHLLAVEQAGHAAETVVHLAPINGENVVPLSPE